MSYVLSSLETQFEGAVGLCEGLDMGLLTAEDDEDYEGEEDDEGYENEGDTDETFKESKRPRVVSS